MSATSTRSIAPSLVLEPGSPADAPPPAHFEIAWGIVFATVLIAAAVAVWFKAHARGWRLPALSLPALSLPQWKTPPDAELCDRAFGRLARRMSLGGRDQRLIRRMADGIGQAPVALLICPSTLEEAAAALKRTWHQAEQYPEREIAALSALEQKLMAFGG